MSDRTEDSKELAALDERVDALLADVQESAERIDAAIPSPPGEAAADEFESGDDVLGRPGVRLAPRARVLPADAHEPEIGESTGAGEFETADEALAEAAAEMHAAATPVAAAPRMVQSRGSEPEPMHERVATPVAVPASHDLSATEFSSPEAIHKLDEKLAASAAELSSGAGDVVDDSDTEAQMAAGSAAPAPAPAAAPAVIAASTTPSSSVPAAPVKTAAAPVAASPAHPAAPKVTPVAAAPVAAVPVGPGTPKEPALVKASRPGVNVGSAAATVVRPVAEFTSRLSPGVRQTIAYAAVVTLFQAACLWGFLVFKGPPGEPVPTSEPVILRKPGDPPASHETHKPAASGHAATKKVDAHGASEEHGEAPKAKTASHGAKDSHAKAKEPEGGDSHAKAPKKTASKTKAGAKKEEHADAGGH